MLGELAGRPAAREETALISKLFELDNKTTLEFSFSEEQLLYPGYRLDDPEFRNWNDKTTAVFSIFSLLMQYFVGEVPCE